MYFTIEGIPKALKRHRDNRYGGKYDPSKKDKKDLLLQVMKYAPKPPITAPIRIMLIFYMPRPKYHFRTKAGKPISKLKPNQPEFHIFTPDLDNLVKMVCDSLNGVFYKDDSQIAQIKAEKIYCDVGENPKTEIHIEQI